MNRSILIVICDFLLISLLAFSSVDITKVSDDGKTQTMKLQMATNPPSDNGKDLAAVMQLALEEERRSRDQLMGELAQTRRAVGERDAQAQSAQRQVETVQKELQTREQESARLQEAQTNLLQQFTSAQSSIEALNQQLRMASSETLLSREKLLAMQEEARKQTDQASNLQERLAELARSNQMVLAERQQLAGRLEVAEVERRHATEQAARMQEQVKVEREEKARLAEGIKTLANKSGELAQEVRESRPLAPNAIYNDFLSNRVEAFFNAFKSGVLMDSTKRAETQTVLVGDGTNIYALCHVQDTPLTLTSPGTEWERLTGTLGRSTMASFVAIRSLSFSAADPRVVLIPVTDAEAKRLGGKIYRISPDPFKFQDAVLVGTQEGYYGECKFQIDPETPNHVKLDRNVLKGMFGKFNPSRGDLVFSHNGDLMGVMANNTYCVMLRRLDATATIQFGEDIRPQRPGETLSRLYSHVNNLPLKLQQ